MCIRDRAGLADWQLGLGHAFEIDPVSYTHLDVYKRQAMRGALGRRVSLAVSGSTSAALVSMLPSTWDVSHSGVHLHAVRRLAGPVVETEDWT